MIGNDRTPWIRLLTGSGEAQTILAKGLRTHCHDCYYRLRMVE